MMRQEKPGAALLRAARLERNLTQEQLAAQLGTTKLTISRWERGEIIPSLYYRQKLCDLFGKSPYALGFLPSSEDDEGDAGASEGGSPTTPPLSPPLPPARMRRVVGHAQHAWSRIALYVQAVVRSIRHWSTGRYAGAAVAGVIAGTVLLTLGGLALVLQLMTSQPSVSASRGGTLLYTFHSPHGQDIFNVEWAPHGKGVVCVIGNGTAQVIAASHGIYRPTVVIRAINVATWAPDGTRIASANADKSVRVWSAADGKQLARYDGPTRTVSGLAWSPNGRYLAAGDGAGDLWVWDTATSNLVAIAHLDDQRIWWVAWSPNGQRIATASADHTARIWEVATRTVIHTYQAHTAAVLEVMWSPDGKYVVSTSEDATARVWDATSGTTVVIYRGHTDQVLAAVWSPDGKRIASSSADGTAQVWGGLTGSPIMTYRGHTGKVWAVSWSQDNRIASVSADGTLQIWQAPAA